MADRISKRRGAAQDKEQEVSEETVDPGTEAVEAPAAESKQSKKTPVPEGFLSPVDYAKHLGAQRGEEVKPQIIYGYIKNSKDFPSEEREGLPRFIVNVQAADEWMAAAAQRKADRAAKKEAAAAAKAETAGEENAA